jgi:hypothetical protein
MPQPPRGQFATGIKIASREQIDQPDVLVTDAASFERAAPSARAALLDWQRRTDRADASCVAVWPRVPGWLRMETQGT